jgi:hypothetical protein
MTTSRDPRRTRWHRALTQYKGLPTARRALFRARLEDPQLSFSTAIDSGPDFLSLLLRNRSNKSPKELNEFLPSTFRQRRIGDAWRR